MEKIDSLIEKIKTQTPQENDLAELLAVEDKTEMQKIFRAADEVRREYCGDGILVRGIIEYTNYCRNTCLYCGLNKNNHSIQRYRLDKNEILESAEIIHKCGVKTVVLQGGEDPDISPDFIADIVSEIKKRFGAAVTLSSGEWEREVYKLWKDAGADRYLLKIETSDKKLYEKYHPDMSYEQRIRCLEDLIDLGYQAGSGTLVGLKGQTPQILARDIIFFNKYGFDMLGMGLFIPHKQTELGEEKIGSLDMTMKMLALTRIVTKNTHLPATTATASFSDRDHRLDALRSGANVIMPNFTPGNVKKLYEIYPGKKCVTEAGVDPVDTVRQLADETGRLVDLSHGHTLKWEYQQ
ncbi:[FeFe] hydrogenase H-cluster radical SAM maturase HydE [Sedimentisphaera salicampi]|uniref:Biotin synthase n=1 Tax=Sedimentisphaera salicampi TaxID=1941349 RepID=A0A1W6LNK5_9BACT|nr:[FeFe] hydrogenase H-cluster radical SAM maturase HydE [Sedimentisphaera salicampi]ARN57326.1 Biotin synthase [Sedimentisphaera salicampi]